MISVSRTFQGVGLLAGVVGAYDCTKQVFSQLADGARAQGLNPMLAERLRKRHCHLY